MVYIIFVNSPSLILAVMIFYSYKKSVELNLSLLCFHVAMVTRPGAIQNEPGEITCHQQGAHFYFC